MSILDVFNFKKKLQEVATKENLDLIRNCIKDEIMKQVKAKIPGEEKMNAVVEKVATVIRERLKSDNKIVQFIVEVIIIKNIRLVCQGIYEDLKQVVKGL